MWHVIGGFQLLWEVAPSGNGTDGETCRSSSELQMKEGGSALLRMTPGFCTVTPLEEAEHTECRGLQMGGKLAAIIIPGGGVCRHTQSGCVIQKVCGGS